MAQPSLNTNFGMSYFQAERHHHYQQPTTTISTSRGLQKQFMMIIWSYLKIKVLGLPGCALPGPACNEVCEESFLDKF